MKHLIEICGIIIIKHLQNWAKIPKARLNFCILICIRVYGCLYYISKGWNKPDEDLLNRKCSKFCQWNNLAMISNGSRPTCFRKSGALCWKWRFYTSTLMRFCMLKVCFSLFFLGHRGYTGKISKIVKAVRNF